MAVDEAGEHRAAADVDPVVGGGRVGRAARSRRRGRRRRPGRRRGPAQRSVAGAGSLVTSSPMPVTAGSSSAPPATAAAPIASASSRRPTRRAVPRRRGRPPGRPRRRADVGGRRGEDDVLAAPAPAVRAAPVATVTRSAGAADARCGPRRSSRARGARRGRGVQQLGADVNRRARRWPAARRVSTARALLEAGRSTAWLSLPRRQRRAGLEQRAGRADPVAQVALGRRAEADAGAAAPPSRAMSSAVRWVACTAVVRGPSAPGVGEQRGRGAAVGGEAGVVLGAAARRGARAAARSPRPRRPRSPAASRGTARTEWIGARRYRARRLAIEVGVVDPLGPGRGVPSPKRRWAPSGGRARCRRRDSRCRAA